ncbi:MAG: TolC family protein [Bacteroidetes bacterium]|nr:MAG: TolC family protein [Bacteroidota bacterium]
MPHLFVANQLCSLLFLVKEQAKASQKTNFMNFKHTGCMLLGLLLGWGASLAQAVLPLNEAIALALQKNFDVQLAQNDAEIAQLQNNWGNAGRLPTVNATGGYNYSRNNLDQRLVNGTNIKRNGASFENQNLGVQGQWRVFNGFRVVAAKARLEAVERIGQTNIKAQANQVVYNVVQTYLNILRFQAQKAATEEGMLLVEERMKLADNRFKIGTAAKSDYLQALVDYNQAKNTLIAIQNAIAQSKTQLNNLLARGADDAFLTSDSVSSTQLPPRSTLLLAIDTLNPALLMAKEQMVVLAQQAREINAQRLPTVTLNLGAGLNNSLNSAGFTLRNTTYGPNTGIGLAIPIYQGGVVKQQLKVNQVLQKSQQVQFDAIKNNLQTALANAYNSFDFAKDQFNLEEENLKAVKENTAIAMERFRKGTITTVELRQTQFNLIESQTRRINALYQMKQSEADVLLILGKLVE